MDASDASTILSEILSCAHDAIGDQIDNVHGEIMEALFSDGDDLDNGVEQDDIVHDDDEAHIDGMPTRVALAWSIILAQHRDNVEVPHAIHRASVDAIRSYIEGVRNE